MKRFTVIRNDPVSLYRPRTGNSEPRWEMEKGPSPVSDERKIGKDKKGAEEEENEIERVTPTPKRDSVGAVLHPREDRRSSEAD